MCGLVGIMSSNMLPKHKDALASMLYLDTWRGRDSTGVAALRQNADTQILKATIPGYEFVEGPKLDHHLRLNDFLWIGHNRFGTVGKNTKTNAHPFSIEDQDGGCVVVGAHNGTLKNKHVLIDHAKFGTDSEALYNNIAEEGVEKTIEKVEGAWALTYYDHIFEQFRVLRNKERPLFFAWSEDKKSLFWASETWMLRVSTQRCDIKLFEDKIFSFDEDTLYCFAAPMKMNEEIVLTEKKGGLVGKTPAFFQGQQGGGSSGWTPSQQKTATTNPSTGTGQSRLPLNERFQYRPPRRWDADKKCYVDPPLLTSNTPSGTATPNPGEKQPPTNDSGSTKPPYAGSVTNTQQQSNVLSISDAKKFKGYQGVLLSASELKDQIAGGCAWCEEEMIHENERFAWLAPSKPICHKCLDGTSSEEEEKEQEVQQTSTVH